MSNKLLNLISNLRTVRVDKFAEEGSDGIEDFIDAGIDADIHEGANAVASLRDYSHMKTKYHALLLDLDVPAYLVPSTTPGHSHLYVDVAINEDDYFELLDMLADCGVIEEGYAIASKRKGGTFLRLPWVKKQVARQPASSSLQPESVWF